MVEYVLERDGKRAEWIGRRYATRDDALIALHTLQGQSWDYALTHGGWAIVEVPSDRWDAQEALELQRRARRIMSDHDCGGTRSIDARVNCQACCLAGYQPASKRDRDGDVRTDGPNVSNWQRDYVQAGYRIPARWMPLLAAALDGSDGADNPGWQAGLARDVATFGVNGQPYPAYSAQTVD